jgi:S-phase kinase-associated protein 1
MATVILLPGDNADHTEIKISRKAACLSKLIESMLVDDDDNEIPQIPLLEVSKDILYKVVEFLNKHQDDPMQPISKPIQTTDLAQIVGEWDTEYINVDQQKLFKLILAANYLDIPSLLELGLCKIATMIKNKEPDEVKKLLNIDLEITPEEEKAVRDANPWIFQIND